MGARGVGVRGVWKHVDAWAWGRGCCQDPLLFSQLTAAAVSFGCFPLPPSEPLRLNLTLPGSNPANPSAPRGLNFSVPRNVTLDADQLQVC